MKTLITWLLCIPVLAWAAPDLDKIWPAPPQPSRHVIYSEIVEQNIILTVDLPPGYGTGSGDFPVLYLVDGNVYSSQVNSPKNMLIWDSIITPFITVGVDTENYSMKEWVRNREYFLTPTSAAAYDPSEGQIEKSGGGPKLAECFKKEILPFIESEYRTKKNDRTLAGHSFGGLFALYAFFNHTDMFQKYLASSPSLAWDDKIVFKYESSYAELNEDLKAKVFLSFGDLENHPDYPGIDWMNELVDKLASRDYPGLELEKKIHENENHLSVLAPALREGIKYLYKNGD